MTSFVQKKSRKCEALKKKEIKGGFTTLWRLRLQIQMEMEVDEALKMEKNFPKDGNRSRKTQKV